MENIKTEVKKEESNEMVQITKGQLKGLLDRVESLEKGSRFEKPKRITERTATMRLFEDKPVVWYGNVQEKINKETGKKVSWMDIKLLGEEKPVTVNYIDFLNSTAGYENTSVDVKINKQFAEEVIKNQGTKNAENPDEAGIWGKKFQEREVDLEVKSVIYTVEVEIMNGQHQGEVFTVPGLCLNQ